ncbi:unannotated protein [freshwater metagenome]|uniref:Unannotated protein n=1 Tax=freshwater metagenome TaxID=449393 RepID=A0A6J7JRC4_9ZZZZ
MRATEPSPSVPATLDGAPGTVRGVTSGLEPPVRDAPATFRARTVTVYGVPLSSPSQTAVVVVPLVTQDTGDPSGVVAAEAVTA